VLAQESVATAVKLVHRLLYGAGIRQLFDVHLFPVVPPCMGRPFPSIPWNSCCVTEFQSCREADTAPIRYRRTSSTTCRFPPGTTCWGADQFHHLKVAERSPITKLFRNGRKLNWTSPASNTKLSRS
jgi:hypothetical protein